MRKLVCVIIGSGLLAGTMSAVFADNSRTKNTAKKETGNKSRVQRQDEDPVGTRNSKNSAVKAKAAGRNDQKQSNPKAR